MRRARSTFVSWLTGAFDSGKKSLPPSSKTSGTFSAPPAPTLAASFDPGADPIPGWYPGTLLPTAPGFIADLANARSKWRTSSHLTHSW